MKQVNLHAGAYTIFMAYKRRKYFGKGLCSFCSQDYYTGTFHVKYKWNNDELSELFSCGPKNSDNTVNDTIIIIKKLCIYSKNKLNIIIVKLQKLFFKFNILYILL